MIVFLMPLLQSLNPGSSKQGIISTTRAIKYCKEKNYIPFLRYFQYYNLPVKRTQTYTGGNVKKFGKKLKVVLIEA